MHLTLTIPVLLVLSLLMSACQPVVLLEEIDSEPASDANSLVPRAVEFEATDVACPEGNIILSDSPFLAGNSEIEVLQESGEMHFSVNATFFPTAFPDAHWVVPGEGFDMPDGGFVVMHRGDGVGALEGSRIVLTATPAEGIDELPCEPVGPVVKLEGVILSEMVEADSGISVTEFVDYDLSCPDGSANISVEPMTAGHFELEPAQDPIGDYFMVNLTQYPDAYPNATWVAPGQGILMPDDGFIAIHRGHGTGEFEGGRILWVATTVEELDDAPCEPEGLIVVSEGIIIMPDVELE